MKPIHRHIKTKTFQNPYIITASVLAVICLFSLRRNGYIAGGDIFPAYFLPGNRVLEEALSLWTDRIVAIGSPHFLPTEFVWSLFGRPWNLIGISGETIEFFFFTSLVIWEGLGIAYFVCTLFPQRRLAAIITGISLPISLYNVLTFINPIGAFSIGFFPWFAGFFLRRLQDPPRPVIFGCQLGLASLGLYVIAGTPPMAVFFVLWALLWACVGWIRWKSFQETWRGLLLGLVLAFCLNLWWAYSAYLTLFGSPETVQQTYAGPFEWAFVHRNASIMNMLSMQGYWSWGQVEYHPWSALYHDIPLLHFSLYLPLFFAVIGIILIPYRKKTGLLLLILLVSLFMTKGLHDPFAWVNSWLYLHAPFFWLFRDPQVEFNITLYLSLFTLAGLGIDELYRRSYPLFTRIKLAAARAKSISFVLAILLFFLLNINGFAFITGVFLPEKEKGVSPVVNIPPYWFEAANYLNKQAGTSRILLLPNNDFYQMYYNWGYYGWDGIAHTLIHSPVMPIEPEASGYLAGSPAFQHYLAQLLYLLQKNPEVDISKMLKTLGIEWIILRHDIVHELEGRNIGSPASYLQYLQQQPNIKKERSFGALDIYKVEDTLPLVHTYSGTGHWNTNSPIHYARAANLAGGIVPWLFEEKQDITQAVGRQEHISTGAKMVWTSNQDGQVEFTPKTVNLAVRLASPDRLQVRLTGPEVSVETNPYTWKKDVTFSLPPKMNSKVAIEVNGNSYFFNIGTIKKEFKTIGAHGIPEDLKDVNIRLWQEVDNQPLTSQWSEIGDCNKYDDRSLRQVGITATPVQPEGIELQAADHSACVKKYVPYKVGGKEAFAIQLDYLHVQGTAPSIAITNNGDVLSKVELPPRKVWDSAEIWLPIKPGEGNIELFAYAHGDGKEITVNRYRNASIRRFSILQEQIIDLGTQKLKVPAGEFSIEKRNTLNLLEQYEWGDLFNANATTPMTNKEAGLKVEFPSEGSIDIKANTQAAGIGKIIKGVGGQHVQLKGQVRSIQGYKPVIKLATPGGEVFWESEFTDTRNWQSINETLYIKPESDIITMYVYAYTTDGQPTHIRYRDLALNIIPPGSGSMLWVAGEVPTMKKVVWSGQAPEYTVSVPKEANILVLNNTFHHGWQPMVNGKALPWEHVAVNGLVNGWILPDDPPENVQLVFRPVVLFNYLKTLGIISFVLTILTLIFLKQRKSKVKAS